MNRPYVKCATSSIPTRPTTRPVIAPPEGGSSSSRPAPRGNFWRPGMQSTMRSCSSSDLNAGTPQALCYWEARSRPVSDVGK
jgi:hypothetical protein